MATLDNLGYNTYVLGTIKAVIECKKILVYNRNVLEQNPEYRRINLYNLEDIFFSVLYPNGIPNQNCLELRREFDLEDSSIDISGIPFEYICDNGTTNGFNMIIYINSDNNPIGFTEFMNIQGRVSNYINIFLKFKIKTSEITLELSNSLYRVKNNLSDDFIGPELNKFSSSSDIKKTIDRIPKDQKYTSHLSAFLEDNNRSNIFLNDRTLLYSKELTKINLVKDADIFDGTEYTNYQIGYYDENDIVIYAWKYIDDSVGYYYRIMSLINPVNIYKYTRLEGDTYIDVIKSYDDVREDSKDLLYCAGKYLVFRINYRGGSGRYGIVAMFDTTTDSWVKSDKPNIIVDQLDTSLQLYELPKSTSIQNYESALELLPPIANTYYDVREYINRSSCFDIIKKVGDWFFIKQDNIYVATCSMFSVSMTENEYSNCIVINNSTILINNDSYYTIYHGDKRKNYTTERARYLSRDDVSLDPYELRSGIIYVCNDDFRDEYISYYENSEIAIVQKNDKIYNTFLDSYRRQPIYTGEVPNNIVGALGSIIFYINQNKINYI